MDGHKHGNTEQPTPPMRLLGGCPRSAFNLSQIFGFELQGNPRSRAGELDDSSTEASLPDRSEGGITARPRWLLPSLISCPERGGRRWFLARVNTRGSEAALPRPTSGFHPSRRDRGGNFRPGGSSPQ